MRHVHITIEENYQAFFAFIKGEGGVGELTTDCLYLSRQVLICRLGRADVLYCSDQGVMGSTART